MTKDRSPATVLLTGLALIAGCVLGAAFTVGMIEDTQARKSAPLCVEGQTSDCLLRVSGHMEGPSETEEAVGDEYFFFPAGDPDAGNEDSAAYTGQRSDRLWDVRGRVVAAYYWNGEVVGIEDPDGVGVLIRSERFSLRGPLTGAFAELSALLLGLCLLAVAWRRRGEKAGRFSTRDADEPKERGSTVLTGALGGAAAAATLVWMPLLGGAGWWFVVLLLLLTAVGVGWFFWTVHRHRPENKPRRTPPAPGSAPTKRSKNAKRRR